MTAPSAAVPCSQGTHWPTLDGLRGVAVLLVLAFHFAHLDGDAGVAGRLLLGATGFGWSGVDLFFVLSGFLITGVLLDAKGSQGYFRTFYARRAVRIFPLYYAYLAAVFLVAPRLAPSAIDVKPASQGWLWSYLGNFLFARERGFEASPYAGHFWSLAVEEQFYLLWPFAVWLLSPRRLWAATLALIGIAFAARFAIHRTTWNATAAYVLTPCRADGLAVGALVAQAWRGGGRERFARLAPWALAAAAAAVLATWVVRGAFFGGDPVVQVWAFTPLAVGYGAVLVLSLSSGTGSALGRALSARWLRGAGRYSYGLYVLHYPIFRGLEGAGLGPTTFATALGSGLAGILAFSAVAGAASFAAALASWHLLEKRFLKFRDLLPYGRAAQPAGRVGVASPTPT